MPRKIISIPTLHAQDESAFNVFAKFEDEKMPDDVKEKVSRQWALIREETLKLNIDFSKVKIYAEAYTPGDPATEDHILTGKYIRQNLSEKHIESFYKEQERIMGGVSKAPSADLFVYLLARGASPVFVEDETNKRKIEAC